MKRFVRPALTFALLLTLLSMTDQKKSRVVFFGDSITEAGVKPGGYIVKLTEALQKKGRGADFELIGSGIGGNKVYDLLARMDIDVLQKSPDVVVIYVGVNDVWHKASFGTGTDADKFEKFYTAIIKKMQEKRIRVVLTTPAAIGEKTDHSNQQDGDLNHYSGIIRRLAAANNCGLVDLRKTFLAYNLKNNADNKASGILTTDRVHLNETGNTLVADQMLEALMAIK